MDFKRVIRFLFSHQLGTWDGIWYGLMGYMLGTGHWLLFTICLVVDLGVTFFLRGIDALALTGKLGADLQDRVTYRTEREPKHWWNER